MYFALDRKLHVFIKLLMKLMWMDCDRILFPQQGDKNIYGHVVEGALGHTSLFKLTTDPSCNYCSGELKQHS